MSFGQSPFYSTPSFGGPPSHTNGPAYRPQTHPFTPAPNEIEGYSAQPQWHHNHADLKSGFHFSSTIQSGSSIPHGFSNEQFGANMSRTWSTDLNLSRLRPTRNAFSGAYRGIDGASWDLRNDKPNLNNSKKDAKEKDKRSSELRPTGIAALSIEFDPPVEDCELKPHITLKCENGSTVAVEDENDCHYKWFRGQKRMCDYTDCSKGAELQCMVSVKVDLPSSKSYFCSVDHFLSAWKHYHAKRISEKIDEMKKKNDGKANWLVWNHDDGENDVSPNKPNSTNVLENLKDKKSQLHKRSVYCRFPPVLANSWTKVSEKGRYTPNLKDTGSMLLLEVRPKLKGKNGNIKQMGDCICKVTKPVLRRPPPPPNRKNIPTLIDQCPNSNDHQFTVMTYNILAQLYTNNTIYPYCPFYALHWNYRKHNLLREITTLNADIICLQEVQGNHFEEFFLPHLSEEGYDGIFKGKTRADFASRGAGADPENVKKMDGCAIFYKKDRFALMEQYHVEFNEAAKHMFKQQHYHGHHNANYNQLMKRLLKGNIALVLVLEEIPAPEIQTPDPGRRGRRRKRKLCVANTHIYWDPEFADIKLWQTWVLCQELSKLVSQRDLPLILAGDFNSQPRSAVYDLLSEMQLRHNSYEAFRKDNLKLLPDFRQISHELQLTSAYSFMGEPEYTNYTGHFIGILDYIWYTKSSVMCLCVLDVGSPEDIQGTEKALALPSTQRPSDHLSLYSTFVFL